ncbi:MAG: ATP-binding protein [Armatimonadia bacterium]
MRKQDAIELGTYLDLQDRDLTIAPADLAYHTAILAQSGSGKSSFLGRLVEEILLKTLSKVIILDLNGDFRRFTDPADPESQKTAQERKIQSDFASRWQKLRIRRIRPAGLTWADFPLAEQVSILGLDWQRDGMEIELWDRCIAEVSNRGVVTSEAIQEQLSTFCKGILHPTEPVASETRLALKRLDNALNKVSRWSIFGGNGPRFVFQHSPQLHGHDIQVIDLPSVSDAAERMAVVSCCIRKVWEAARDGWEAAAAAGKIPANRVPTFIVIDEAHNLVPKRTDSALAETVASSLHQVAAEGRKYGLFLILASQRPAKIRRGLLSECENTCLLRLQSPIDHQAAADTWGIPLEDAMRTRHFRTGQGILFGRWVPSTTAFVAARRRTIEGGASLDAQFWAKSRDL